MKSYFPIKRKLFPKKRKVYKKWHTYLIVPFLNTEICERISIIHNFVTAMRFVAVAQWKIFKGISCKELTATIGFSRDLPFLY